jgi:acyl dehydratase
MRTRELTRPPRILPLYLRTAATLVPGANRLPGLPGGGQRVPELELTLRGALAEPERLAKYREVCGFTSAATLPVTYPHVLAFPLHMALMADPGFPLPAVGLVHVENQITRWRAIGPSERLDLSVHATQLDADRRGRAFAIVTTAHARDELVWEGRSKMLSRGGASPVQRTRAQAGGARDTGGQAGAGGQSSDGDHAAMPSSGPRAPGTGASQATWHLAGDLGRRYGAVSGDRNPIHMHSLAAKAFGFPGAIAHGMWTKARCLAALEDELPEAFTTGVRFLKPLLLPASVRFERERAQDDLVFSLCGQTRAVHLEGRLQAAAPGAPR